VVLACHRRESPVGTPPVARLTSALARPLEDKASVPRLDEEKLKRFWVYRSQVSRLERDLAREESEARARLPDGGFRVDGPALTRGLALLKREDEARSLLLKESGLTREEARGIERMVADFVGERMLSNGASQDLMVEQLEQILRQVPADRRTDFEQALNRERAARDKSKALVSQRDRWGDANIDLLLAHEAEL